MDKDKVKTPRQYRNNKFDAIIPVIIKNIGKQLSDKLNSLGGPVKDSAEWKRTFTDWKCQVKAKTRNNRIITKEIGNIGYPIKPLSDTEERLLDVTGWVVVNCISHVNEIGIDILNNEDIREESEKESPNQSKISKNQPVEHSVEESLKRPSKKEKRQVLGCKTLKESNCNDESDKIIILKEIAKNVLEMGVIEENLR